jgi:diacylglycerol kinase (ATP)
LGGIGVITNPRSRQNLRNPRLARQLGYILGEKGTFAQPTDLDALAATARMFRDHQIDVLCINGGDGTMHTALTAMVKAYDGKPLPRVALLRSGTMNTVAHGLGIRASAAEFLDYVVQRYHADAPMPTVRRNLLDVDGQQYGFLFGNGLIARFLEVYYEGGEPTPVKAVWLLIRASLSAAVGGKLIQRLTTPYVGSVEVGGQRWEPTRYLTVAAGTVDDIGVGFRPFWKAPRHPGSMHALGIATLNAMDVVRELPRIYRAKQVQHPDFLDEVCQELVLRSEEPISYMVDGDFHRGGQVLTVRIGPPVDFVVPEPAA